MENSTPLTEYVEQHAAEGQVDVQAAEFSVSEEAALAKLSGVLENPQHWVLKAVQAGVSAGCQEISFKIGLDATEVCWLGLKPLKANDIRVALTRSTPSEDPFVFELIIGLRAVFGMSGFEFCGDGKLVASKERQLQLSDSDSAKMSLVVRHPGRGVLGVVDRVRREALAEQTQVLARKCLFSPVPISVDGRLVTSGQHRILHGRRHDGVQESPFPLIDVDLNQDGALLMPLALAPDFNPRSWSKVPIVNGGRRLQKPAGKLVMWSHIKQQQLKKGQVRARYEAIQEPGVVNWLRYGVVCESEQLFKREELGLALALDASSARSDLSGLSIGEKPLTRTEVATLTKNIWREALPLIRSKLQLRPSFLGLPRLPELRWRVRNMFWGVIAAGILTIPFSSYLRALPIDTAVRVGLWVFGAGAALGFALVPRNPIVKQIADSIDDFKGFG